MRLIDADAFLGDAIKSKRFVFSMYDAFNDQYVVETVYKDLAEALNAAPTIDAEPVVRCKDCKHWGTGYGGETEHIKVCEYANYMVSENGYCVYGERKMDEEVQHAEKRSDP